MLDQFPLNYWFIVLQVINPIIYLTILILWALIIISKDPIITSNFIFKFSINLNYYLNSYSYQTKEVSEGL